MSLFDDIPAERHEAAARQGTSYAASSSRSSPRAVLLSRVSSMARLVAVFPPLPVIVFDSVWLWEKCKFQTEDVCWLVWFLTFPVAVAALVWNLAVVGSIFLASRGRRGIPQTVHCLFAILVAAAAGGCLVAVAYQLFHHKALSYKSAIPLVLFMLLIL